MPNRMKALSSIAYITTSADHNCSVIEPFQTGLSSTVKLKQQEYVLLPNRRSEQLGKEYTSNFQIEWHWTRCLLCGMRDR